MNPGSGSFYERGTLVKSNATSPFQAAGRAAQRYYLTRCVHQRALEIQLPHNAVKKIFQVVILNNKLTIVWGSRLSKTNYEYIL